MQLISGPAVPAPSICALCEQGSETYVNTLYNTEEYAPLHMAGVRLVCMGCVSNLADVAGYVPKADLEGARDFARELQTENAVLREKHLEDVDAVIAAVVTRMKQHPGGATKAPVKKVAE